MKLTIADSFRRIMKENNDRIRGRRLTNIESMYLMLPDIPDYNEVINEVCKPFIVINKKEGISYK